MKKSVYILIIIAFVLFSLFSFLIPFEKNALFYIGYGFSILAFLILTMIIFVMNKKCRDLNSKFFYIPILYITIIYVIVEIMIFFIINSMKIPIWLGLIIYFLILGIHLILIILISNSMENNKKIEKNVLEKKNNLKEIEIELLLLSKNVTFKEEKESIKELIEKVKYSDPMSHEKVITIEKKIKEQLEELKVSKNKKEQIANISLLLDERNEKLKMFKK